MSDPELMLELQDIDATLDQIPHRSARLTERAHHGEITVALDAERQTERDALRSIEESTTRIEELEAEEGQRLGKRKRLDAQMMTVASSREADALAAELATLAHERSVADDEELDLMDRVEGETARSQSARARVEQLEEELAAALAALEEAEGLLAAERAELLARREAGATRLGEAALSRYERLRQQFGGIAISRLHAGTCGACHLEQSRAAQEAMRTAGEGAEFECEQCGRLLVL